MFIFKHLYYKNFCKKIIKNHIDYERDKFDDRNVLEEIIFPFVLAKFNPKSVLDIGREDYQAFYNEFFEGRDLYTIDMNPKHAEYGMPEKHVIDNVINLKKHYQDKKFDFILINGVYGWGLNEEKDIQTAFNAIYDLLNDGGIVIIGYNEVVYPFEKIEGLNKLNKYKFKPLKADTFKCINGNHTYKFYTK